MKTTASVRLSPEEVSAIINAAVKACASVSVPLVEVSIFGSRADLQKRGGDIDIFIIISKSLPQGTKPRLATEMRLDLHSAIGEQKIDIVIDDGSNDLGAFRDLIHSTKVILWNQQR